MSITRLLEYYLVDFDKHRNINCWQCSTTLNYGEVNLTAIKFHTSNSIVIFSFTEN